ncbi:[LysW]-lysine hydrolase [Micromonospora sp. DT43]|uniref:[LysW]-lysine hydrolase n=1 Tax=Micromonospora sp. DT43 TaxID=3393440 RepID=UPI003CF030DA
MPEDATEADPPPLRPERGSPRLRPERGSPQVRPGVVTDTFAAGLLRRMVETPSPSYHEAALARSLVDAMGQLGFDAYVDPVGNVVGEIGRGDGPVVLLIGHLDTVPGGPAVRAEDGRLYGRGAVDAKGPLAAMVCAAASADIGGRIVVVGAVEEEIASRGSREIRRRLPRPDAVVVGEPSGWSTITLGYKGKLDLSYRVSVPATHPSNPVAKASELAVRCWTTLLELLGPESGNGSFDRPGATLLSLRADQVRAEAELSVRTPPGYDVDGLLRELAQRTPDGDLTVVNRVAACRADHRNPVVRALSAGIRAQRARPALKVKTGTSDMNVLAEQWDVPMATYGPGDSSLDHSDDEHIVLADYLRGIAVLRHALRELDARVSTAPPSPAPQVNGFRLTPSGA